MFSCLLLHSASTSDPYPAQELDVNIQVVGLVGKGDSFARYSPKKDLNDAVLYVPSMIAHREASRQQLRLTDCQIQLREGGSVCAHSLRLAKANGTECSSSSKKQDVPEYAELKRKYRELITAYCGSISVEDVLLHVGRLPAGSELDVHFKFLIRFSSAAASSSSQYRVLNRLPAHRLSYACSLASTSPVVDVSAIQASASVNSHSADFEPTPMESLRWEHLDGARQNTVHVSYEELCVPEEEGSLAPRSSGFVVQLDDAGSGASGCYTSVVPPHLQSSLGSTVNGTGSPYSSRDGVMMLSCNFGRGLLSSALQSDQQQQQQQLLSPSEFVFVVDCSGSMSGTNIQSATDTLITCIKSLPVGCYFNVVAFGSTYRNLFHSSVKYTQANMERAVQFANQLQANLGGTELLAPLKWIFKQSRPSGLPCQVFIVTDGGVTNTQLVVHSARKNRHQAR